MTEPFDHELDEPEAVEPLVALDIDRLIDDWGQRLVNVEDKAERTRLAVGLIGLLLAVVGLLAVVAFVVAAWS